MKVHVKVYGALARPAGGGDEVDVELPDGAQVGELLARLGYPPAHVRHIAAFVAGQRVRAGQVLADGVEVALTVMASGG
jgi:hypothetical protein